MLHLNDHIFTCVVDIETGNHYVYGQKKGYNRRVYLLYDGTHYDALAMTANPSLPEELDETVFDPENDVMQPLARQIAQEARQKRQFVNMSKCSAMCGVCQTGFAGQVINTLLPFSFAQSEVAQNYTISR